MEYCKFITMLLVATIIAFIACGGGEGGTTIDPFDSATTPGQAVSITVGSQTITMIYANNQASITFPFSPSAYTPVNDQKATLTRKFFMSEIEVTNALFKEVLQWARNNNKIVENPGAHNEINTTTKNVKYGGKVLYDFNFPQYAKISYNPDTDTFTVATGYENHPVVHVSWYGAIMFCNWLTEMRDGNTTNVVYTGISESWNHTDTVENTDKTGYRLPSSEEWEYHFPAYFYHYKRK